MINIIRTIHNFIAYNTKLRTKLIFSYFLLIIIPVFAFIHFIYTDVSHSLLIQSKFSSNQSFEQTVSYLENNISNVISISDQIAFNQSLNKLISETEHVVNPSSLSKYYEVQNILNSYYSSTNMHSIELYIDSSYPYISADKITSQGASLLSMDSEFAIQAKKDLYNTNDKILWISVKNDENPEKSLIKGVRFLKMQKGFGNYENVGLVSVNLSLKSLNEIVSRSNVYQNSFSYIIDENDQVISSSKDTYNAKDYLKYSRLYSISLNSPQTIQIKNQNFLIYSKKNSYTDWILVSAIPYSSILSSARDIKAQMWIIIIIVILLSYLCAILISNSITKKISSLIRRMKQVQKGNFNAITSVKGTDEMSQLASTYNYMLNTISSYNAYQYQLGQELKMSELRALQEQINPHFLYNTLDLIHWLALQNKTADVSKVVKLLAKYYKLSLNNGNDIVTISDEISHICTYIDLQNYRFKNAVTLAVDIPEQIQKCKIIKLVFQPIIENSLLHGILRKSPQTGLIKITVEKTNKTIIIQITDDGVGMTQETIDSLMSDTSDETFGYGIKNVQSRLKLYYGENYGLQYCSAVNHGTTVTITIPYQI